MEGEAPNKRRGRGQRQNQCPSRGVGSEAVASRGGRGLGRVAERERHAVLVTSRAGDPPRPPPAPLLLGLAHALWRR